MPGSFIDTNVLIYIASHDPVKADRAEQVVKAGGKISVQVLNELSNICRRKMGMSWQEARTFLSMVRDLLPVTDLTIETHDTGLRLAERCNISLFDAMIAASALLADCDRLWSEDMQDGLLIEGRLQVINPFRAGN
jgi:predicted nucleic acid-binding protein